MAPPPAVCLIAGMAWRDAMNMLSTLTCMTRRQSCGAASTTLPRPLIPTLLSRQSSRPNWVSAASTIARACGSPAAATAYSDIVVEAIEPAELGERGIDHRAGLWLVRDIGNKGGRSAALLRD